MEKNLTIGNPLKLILLFSLPVLAGNLFQQFYNIADTAIVGQLLNEKALAAVGCTTSVQFFVFGFCFGIAQGFCVPVAQRFGAQDFPLMRKYFYVGFLTLLVISVIVTVLCLCLCTTILTWMKVTDDIYHMAFVYLFTIFLGIPFILFYNYLSGILRSVGDSKTPFVILVVSTIINICLDYFLVKTIGVIGAGIATVIAQGFSTFLCFIYIIKKFEFIRPKYNERHFDTHICHTLVRIGLPMGLQFSITAIGTMVLQATNNQLGSLYVTSFTAGTKLKQFLIAPYDAFGVAVSTYASQNYGALKYDNIKKGIFQGTLVSIAYGIIATCTLAFGGYDLSKLFIKAAKVEELALSAQYCLIMGYLFWLLGILNVLRPTVQGLGFSHIAIFSGVIEMIARCVVAFGFVNRFKYTAVCWADPVAWICGTSFIIPVMIYCLVKVKKYCEENQTN